jgi:twitching motility protein PilT
MSDKQPLPLIGRIAVQLKMITMAQLQEATSLQGRDPDKRLGDIFLEMGLVSEAQMEKVKHVQRDLVIKHRAKQAMSGRTVPAPEVPAHRVDRGVVERVRSRVTDNRAERTPEEQAERAVAAQAESAASPPLRDEPPPAPASGPAAPAPAASPAPSQPAAPAPPQVAAAPSAPAPPAAQDSSASVPSDAVDADDDGGSLELPLLEPGEADLQRLHGMLRDAVAAGASDIHLHAGVAPKLRLHGSLQETSPTPLAAEEAERLVLSALTPEQRAQLSRHGELDLCYDVAGIGRFRTNVYRQQRGFDAVFRSIPPEPPTFDQLGLPSVLAKHTNYHQGMVLITGPAGCGKSSTMAALVNLINEEREEHILTIEDPIEYVHKSKRCLVNQRHAGRHTESFARALRGALREDPDIIVIGELRDLETISLAMTAAETGHFVLATLHTNNAVRTVNRMIGAFPSNQQDQVRTMLSESLRAVISQRLVVAKDGSGRVPAFELLVVSKAISNLVREQKTVQIRSAIQTGAARGMFLLEQSLNELVQSGTITREEALRHAEEKKLIQGG